MQEFIETYLTDRHTEEQEECFLRLMKSDETFRREYQLSLAALALADFSMDDTTGVLVPCKEEH